MFTKHFIEMERERNKFKCFGSTVSKNGGVSDRTIKGKDVSGVPGKILLGKAAVYIILSGSDKNLHLPNSTKCRNVSLGKWLSGRGNSQMEG